MKAKINLLPKKAVTWDEKIIYFGLHYLRYIIVITQIIVIAVFFFRFKVDQDIIDLKENINEKKEILKSAKPLLDEAIIISDKSQYIRELLDKQKKTDQLIDRAFAYVPKQVVLTTVSIDTSKVNIKGYSVSEVFIKLFYDRLIKVIDTKVNMKNVNKIDNSYYFDLEFFNK